MKNYIKYLAMFILILGSMTSECFANSEISSSSYYQGLNLKKSSEAENLKGTKFLFDTIHDVKSSFKISLDINPKYLNPADATYVTKFKLQSELFQILKPVRYQKLYLKALFDFTNYTL
ncbi:hypothetical protein [Flavobacterium turcicum]|uniref:Uncharacterized protein n=1 Tax=Flavobacterium turcicum TaxID=2764718 RepID=A0ABR7JFH4_9FLAO|nr:hypothetical protein [Flavobacterium turcicum]MBC5863238.1 hypothetical protein [Flavobacterium turcicum]NHL01970.1 hypothetical protein [Flavobacterium turcicum]